METINTVAQMPVIGWVVLLIIAVLIAAIVFLSGLKVKKGDFEIGIGGKKVDTKIKNQLELERKDERQSRVLFRETQEIDTRLKADLRRIIRELEDDILNIFTQFMKCEFPGTIIINMIKSEFFQRVDDNNLRERLAKTEIDNYIYSVTVAIEHKYKMFRYKLNSASLKCGELYPDWSQIEKSITDLVTSWAESSRTKLKDRIKEKIKLYEESKNSFSIEENKETNVTNQIVKNKKYLSNLGGEND